MSPPPLALHACLDHYGFRAPTSSLKIWSRSCPLICSLHLSSFPGTHLDQADARFELAPAPGSLLRLRLPLRRSLRGPGPGRAWAQKERLERFAKVGCGPTAQPAAACGALSPAGGLWAPPKRVRPARRPRAHSV